MDFSRGTDKFCLGISSQLFDLAAEISRELGLQSTEMRLVLFLDRFETVHLIREFVL